MQKQKLWIFARGNFVDKWVGHGALASGLVGSMDVIMVWAWMHWSMD